MKKLLSLFLLLGLVAFNINAQTDKQNDELRKKMVGKWCNPYSYMYDGSVKGFNYKKNGKCEAIGIPDLDLRTWEVKNGKLYVKGFVLGQDGKTWEPYNTVEKIDKVNKDSLYILATEQPKSLFFYMKMKTMKKKVKPNSQIE